MPVTHAKAGIPEDGLTLLLDDLADSLIEAL
jgi:hypothetical protein